jgi:hypothetical protein
MDGFKEFIVVIGSIIGLIITSMVAAKILNSCDNKQIKKDNTTIEKTNYSNDSLRIELKHIDKDKNEKIIEVKGLNNDSTYKLFKQLIAE